MSTDTERSQATVAQLTDEQRQHIDDVLARLDVWANEKGIPFQALVDAISGGDDTSGDVDDNLPPFHTTLLWTDVFTPSGLKLHVTLREGATSAHVRKLLDAATGALDPLLDAGWQPADRRPLTPDEIAERREAFTEAVDKDADPQKIERPSRESRDTFPAPSAGDTREIEVQNVRRLVTDNGNEYYLVKGWPWTQYGVKAWPDTGKIHMLSTVVNMDEWKVGEAVDFTEVDVKAIVLLKDGGSPDKVVGWTGADVMGGSTE